MPRKDFRQENSRNRSSCDWNDDVHVVNVGTGSMWLPVGTPPLQSQRLLFLLFSCQKTPVAANSPVSPVLLSKNTYRVDAPAPLPSQRVDQVVEHGRADFVVSKFQAQYPAARGQRSLGSSYQNAKLRRRHPALYQQHYAVGIRLYLAR